MIKQFFVSLLEWIFYCIGIAFVITITLMLPSLGISFLLKSQLALLIWPVLLLIIIILHSAWKDAKSKYSQSHGSGKEVKNGV